MMESSRFLTKPLLYALGRLSGCQMTGFCVNGAMTESWRQFIEGDLFSDTDAPWRDDPAYALLLQFAGLRESVGGQVTPALTQAIGLVQALTRVNLLDLVRNRRPAQGLSLGFGM